MFLCSYVGGGEFGVNLWGIGKEMLVEIIEEFGVGIVVFIILYDVVGGVYGDFFVLGNGKVSWFCWLGLVDDYEWLDDVCGVGVICLCF